MEKSSKIYIAGHTGLFGSATVNLLKNMGYNNLILKSHNELDLTRQIDVETFFREKRPQYVFIMCGKVGGIQANKQYMAEFTLENLKMNSNIIEAAHEYNVKKMIYIGSSCMYPKESIQPIKEEYLLKGALEPTNEGYALAKIIGLRLCQYYKKQYGDNFISCIPANVYGPRDSFDDASNHVIPALMKRLHNAKESGIEEVEIWGTGKAQREFLYIDDAVEACVFLMNNYDGEKPINIGTGACTSIYELTHAITQTVGYKGNLTFDSSKPDGMLMRKLDSSDITNMGWKPKVSLRQGLERTYQWYLNNKENL